MTTQPVSVVVIESQPLLLAALSAALLAEGMTVLAQVTDSGKTLQTAKKLKPDLILFSVNSAVPDELHAISTLRQELPRITIVALVTGEARGQAQAALGYGAHCVLSKAASRAELASALQELSQKVISQPVLEKEVHRKRKPRKQNPHARRGKPGGFV